VSAPKDEGRSGRQTAASTGSPMTRRDFLKMAGMAAAAVAVSLTFGPVLAGCGGGGTQGKAPQEWSFYFPPERPDGTGNDDTSEPPP
jgi:hypothetical protein